MKEKTQRGGVDTWTTYSASGKEKTRKREHFAAMPWQNVPALMHRLNADSSPPSLAAQLLIMTSARSHMVRFARWDEFDLEARTWSVPDERMKMRVAFIIPLADEVINWAATDGGPILNVPVRVGQVNKRWNQANPNAQNSAVAITRT